MQDGITTGAQDKRQQAVVIGAGIAGLLAARVLAEYYDQVLVVERDALPVDPRPRAGAPQSYHIHRVLPRGKMILERLFPGFLDGLAEMLNRSFVIALGVQGAATEDQSLGILAVLAE